MPALSAPATRTTFQLPRRPRATPRITVLRKPTQILDSVIVEQCESEDEEEDGAQYATFPAMEGTEETVLNIGAIRERQEKRRDNIFESKVLDKLERRKALANGGGRIDLAKAAAAGSLRVKDGVPHRSSSFHFISFPIKGIWLRHEAAQPRGHRHTQSLNIHPLSDPFSPASPPSSPPVFNFSSLTSPTAFTSAVSPQLPR
ncbi:hypothetical protein BT69DRAFT_412812 [Atractiella rhizophila]|nr:hypothetical protein BT69DRAFT_412812 [Atractiella rhizophila]